MKIVGLITVKYKVIRIMFGGRTLLKWKEPHIIWKHQTAEISLFKRLWLKYRTPFLAGFVTGLVIIITGGVPDSLDALFRLITVVPIFSFGFGFFFVIIYGFAALIFPPRIYVKEKCVMRTYIDSTQTWKYADLKCYHLEKVDLGEHSVLIFVLNMWDEGAVALEVSPAISEHEIHRAMEGRLSHSPVGV